MMQGGLINHVALKAMGGRPLLRLRVLGLGRPRLGMGVIWGMRRKVSAWP